MKETCFYLPQCLEGSCSLHQIAVCTLKISLSLNMLIFFIRKGFDLTSGQGFLGGTPMLLLVAWS